MRSQFQALLTLLVWVAAIAPSHQQLKVEDLTILSVEREIDLSSQLVQTISKLKIENTNASPTKTFLFIVEAQQRSHVAYIGASARDSKQGSISLAKLYILNYFTTFLLTLQKILMTTIGSPFFLNSTEDNRGQLPRTN